MPCRSSPPSVTGCSSVLDDQKKKLDDLYKARDDKAALLKDQYTVLRPQKSASADPGHDPQREGRRRGHPHEMRVNMAAYTQGSAT
ncbi:hypothetical protein QJS66_02485 [Kocuria rhizophila]|nr:hypothetical protein QJS66_02485 [Kocuria rhizophila]